jgi:hypothetical protein
LFCRLSVSLYHTTRGFKRFAGKIVPQNCIAYRHISFKRDQPELLKCMQSGSNRHYMPPVEPANISFQRNMLQQQQMMASNMMATDPSALHMMGGSIGRGMGNNAHSSQMEGMYYNNNHVTTFGRNPGMSMFGSMAGAGGHSSDLAAVAGRMDNSSEPTSSDVLQRLVSQETRSSASGIGGSGGAAVAGDQVLAYEQMMLANQQRAPTSLEAEYRFQQLLNQQQQQQQHKNKNGINNTGPGNSGLGLVGITGGHLPPDNPENTELVRLLRLRDQLERKNEA